MALPLLLATHSALTARKPLETLRHVTTMLFYEKITRGGGLEALNLGPHHSAGQSPCVKVSGKMCVSF